MENKKAQMGEDGEHEIMNDSLIEQVTLTVPSIDDLMNDSPIEPVRLTIPITDDPTLPTLTFRTWVLGPIACIILSFISQFALYRQNLFFIPGICVQLILITLGKLMAATLPSKLIKVPGTRWSFSINPGPFNIKENVLLNILASANSPYSMPIIVARKVYYHKPLNIWTSLLLILTTQLLSYGFAGMFMKFLVNNPYMWYPLTLPDVAFYRALHEVEARPKRGTSKLQLLVIATIASFAYAVIPGYFFPSISALSVVCWFWKSSVTAQLIGSARNGLGIGSFALDWNTISGYIGNPLIYPLSTIINTAVGFITLFYIICPVVYWTNSFHAKKFPFSSYQLYDKDGQVYNISKIINESDLTFNQKGYENYSILYKSVVNIFTTGFGFATITATLSHFVIFHGREFWQQVKQANDNNNSTHEDVHNRLMKKYDPVPQWWFLAILVSSFCLAIYSCEGFGKQLQLPYWGLILACILVMIFILPAGVIQATTGQSLTLMGIVSSMLIGYIYPGRPIGYLVFNAFCQATQDHALSFIVDFKLGHYMKIAPKSMFVAQVTGTIISAVVSLTTTWWLMSTVDNFCDPKHLPKGSPWTCPSMNIIDFGSVTWGLVGPRRVYFPDGIYSKLFYFFFIGLMGPVFVWILLKLFPDKKWIKGINLPVILGGVNYLIAAGAVNYWSFISVGFFFNLIVYKKYKDWWSECNYMMANGLDMGVALQALLTGITQQMSGVYGVNWWGLDVGDHCPLAQCPTAPDVLMEGCPAV